MRRSISLSGSLRLPAILWTASAGAEESRTGITGKIYSSRHLRDGFGSSHSGWEDTQQRGETLDLILRHKRPQAILKDRDWYRNRLPSSGDAG